MCFFSIVFPVVKKKACNNKLISSNIALICYLFKKSLLLKINITFFFWKTPSSFFSIYGLLFINHILYPREGWVKAIIRVYQFISHFSFYFLHYSIPAGFLRKFIFRIPNTGSLTYNIFFRQHPPIS